MKKILVYDSKIYTEESLESLPHEGIMFTYLKDKLNEVTVHLAKDYDSVLTFVNDTLNKNVLDELKKQNKKVIFIRCAGYNNIDIKQAYKNKILIYRVPAYSPYAVAEHAFSLLSTINRRIHKAYNRTREFNFSLEGFTGMDLYNKTIGIIGTGKIGRVMINIAKGYSMNVLAYDPYPNTNTDGYTYVSLEKLFTESDVISLHCPLNKDTKYILNKHAFSLMKKGVIIINTSRGELINSKDLLEAIKDRKVSAAALDVYEEEEDIFYEDRSNHILDDEVLRDLISMPNVIVTSHQAFLTNEALNNIAMTSISNISNYFKGTPNKENEVCYKCENK